jgi:hypothetical protein
MLSKIRSPLPLHGHFPPSPLFPHEFDSNAFLHTFASTFDFLQNKQLEETLDKYLEQIHELEAAKNSATSTTKMVEKVGDK